MMEISSSSCGSGDTPSPLPQLSPRPFQEDAVQACLKRYDAGARRLVIGIPTGGGKTIIALLLALLFLPRYRHMLFLVPRLDLVAQTLVNLQQVEPVGTVSFDEDGSMSIIECE